MLLIYHFQCTFSINFKYFFENLYHGSKHRDNAATNLILLPIRNLRFLPEREPGIFVNEMLYTFREASIASVAKLVIRCRRKPFGFITQYMNHDLTDSYSLSYPETVQNCLYRKSAPGPCPWNEAFTVWRASLITGHINPQVSCGFHMAGTTGGLIPGIDAKKHLRKM